jgi:NTP pyrophosphatase (non-canonical NTP hydrolase)
MTETPHPPIPEILSLAALQKHTADMCRYFEWDTLSNDQVFLLFTEEVGEMAKGIRKIIHLAEDKAKAGATEQERRDNLAEEMADVLSYLADLANRYGVDLDAAYRAKTAHNLNRQWGK